MRVYDLYDKEGRMFAFEVSNFFLGRLGTIRVISAIARVQNVWSSSLSWFSPDVFCRFELDGVGFEAWEPYGDSSRYWIGPEPPRSFPS
jgi:hypothetical protein